MTEPSSAFAPDGEEPPRRSRRWREQRWLVDSMIAAHGPEFDQPRSLIYSAPAGFEALADFQSVTPRVRKFADLHREYASAARRREGKAHAFAEQGREVAARESFFIAAQLWACARWPRFAVDAAHRDCTARLNHCYAEYARRAAHRVERVDLPFGDAALPAWLHLPVGTAPATGWPLVVLLPGMDNNKEQMVAMYGERLLQRGLAVLAVDGPGQAEALVRGIVADASSHADAGRALLAWLQSRADLDGRRVGLRGVSFGSFFGVQWAAALGDRCAGAVLSYVAHEPGLRTLFESASPTFKERFMMMSGHEDEAAFDRFIAGFDARRWARQVTCPVLVQAGGEDELSPLVHTERLMDEFAGPAELVVYEGHKHVLRGGGAVAAGENPDTQFADWLLDRLQGRPARSRRVLVRLDGRSVEPPH